MAEAKEKQLISGGTAKDYDRLYHFVDAVNKLAYDESTRQRISSLSPEAEELVNRISAGEVHTSVLCQIVSKYWKELGLEESISESECYKLETYGRSLVENGGFPAVTDVNEIYNKYENATLKNKEDAKNKVQEGREKLSTARKQRKRFRVFGNVLKVVASAALSLATFVAPIGVFASVVFAPIATGLMTGLGITTIIAGSLIYKHVFPKTTKLFTDCIDKLKKARSDRKAERKTVREAKRELRKNKSNFKGMEKLFENDRNYRISHRYPGFVKEKEPERTIKTNVAEKVSAFDKFMEEKGFTQDQVKLFSGFENEKDFEEYCKANNLNFEELKGKYAQFVSAKKEFEEINNEEFENVQTRKQEEKQTKTSEGNNKNSQSSNKDSEIKEIHFENGNIYVGEVNENGEPNGKGEVGFEDGKKMVGSFKNGKRDGFVELYDEDGKLIESYECVDGNRHGRYVDGKTKEITYYYEDKDVGKGKEGLDEFNRLTKEAEEKKSNAENKTKNGGDEKKEEQSNDQENQQINQNKNDEEFGKQTEIDLGNGFFYVGEVNEQGKPDGKGQIKTEDGIVMQGNFINGKQNGRCLFFDEIEEKNGNKYFTKIGEMDYIDGKRNGEAIEYAVDGKIRSKANYVDDKRHGPFFEDENGELKLKTYFFNGEDVKTKEEFDRKTKEAEEENDIETVEATVENVEETQEVIENKEQMFLPINEKEGKLEPQAGGAGNVIPPMPPTDDNDKETVNVANIDQTLNIENSSEKKPNKCWLAMQCFESINGEPSKEQVEAIRKKTGFTNIEDAKKAYAKAKKIQVEEINLDPAEGKTPNRPWLAKTIAEVVGKDNLSENFKKRTGYDDPDKAKVEYARQRFIRVTKETLTIAGRNGWKTFTAKSKEDVSQMFEKLEQDKRSNIVSSLKGLSKEQISVVLEGMPNGLKTFVEDQLKVKDESKQKDTSDMKVDKTELFKKFNANRKASSGAHFTNQLTKDEFMNFVVKEGIAENGNNQQLKDIWQEYQQNEVKSATLDGEKAPEVQYAEDGTAFYAGEVKTEEVLENCSENPTKEEYVKVAQEQGMTKVEAELSYHGEAETKIETQDEEATEKVEETKVETPVEPETPAKKEEVQIETEPVVKEEPVVPKVEIEVVQDQIPEEKPKTKEEIEEENRIASENRIKEFMDQYEQNVSDENEILFRDYAERNGLSPEEIEKAVEGYFAKEAEENQESQPEVEAKEEDDEITDFVKEYKEQGLESNEDTIRAYAEHFGFNPEEIDRAVGIYFGKDVEKKQESQAKDKTENVPQNKTDSEEEHER